MKRLVLMSQKCEETRKEEGRDVEKPKEDSGMLQPISSLQ